ncbi:nuclear transport factor 2 family protein [Macrococcus equi]|uniref:nuclear transport factor 2 family protein n=1 Tax=Macrococcus equi TaxID=3395462 RepID=UPI0039BDAAC3
MAYFHLLAAWSSQDMEKMKEIISKDIKAVFISDEAKPYEMNYDELIDLFNCRFENEQDWQFEVIYRANRVSGNIVVTEIMRENKRRELLEDKALCTMYFNKEETRNKLVRFDMVMGLKE